MDTVKIKKINKVFSYLFLIILLVSIAISIYSGDWTVLFVSSVALILIFLPDFIGRRFHIEMPDLLKLLFLFFIYAALWLGNIHGYYEKFWWWDLMLHFFSAVGLGIIGFTLIFMLVSKRKVKTSASLLSLFSFSFAMSLGAVWEIFEFTVDNLLGFNMQRSGLIDTMGDLIVDAAGAFLVSLVAYLYIKYGKKNKSRFFG